MHSFIPSLSFLLSLLLLNHLPTALAADLHDQRDLTSVTETIQGAAEVLAVAAKHDNSELQPSVRRRHAKLSGNALRSLRSDGNQTITLYPGRRAAGAHFTNFVTGLGACGGTNVDSDFVVALNREQWDGGAHCGAAVTITINGKTVGATIVDRCLECGYNNLDFTNGLFEQWAPILTGTLNGDWEYGSGAPAPPKTTPKPQPTTTTTPPPPLPTSTSTTTVPASSTTTTSGSSTTTKNSGSSTTTSPPAGATPTFDQGAIQQMYLAVLGMGGIIMGSLQTSSN